MRLYCRRLSGVRHPRLWIGVTASLMVLLAAPPAPAQVRIGSICRVKGQEENRLHGVGLVVGLNGTGDGRSFAPTITALAAALNQLGQGEVSPAAVGRAENVALVLVQATVPRTGAREGDRLDCTISSIGAAESLRGGWLFVTPLQGPDITDTRIFALAEGAVIVEDPESPTTGRVQQAVQLVTDFPSAFALENEVTLVLDDAHSSFQTASEVARAINAELSFQADGMAIARAVDPKNVVVGIPPQYLADPVDFVAQVLDVSIYEPPTEARVLINERTGVVLLSEHVAIRPVVVTARNLTVSVGDAAETGVAGSFVAVDPASEFRSPGEQASLANLLEALNALNVPPEDVIAIIRDLHRSGSIHARLIVE